MSTLEPKKPNFFALPPKFGVSREEFGKKCSNLEQSVQRIKFRKSLLMAEICASEEKMMDENGMVKTMTTPPIKSTSPITFPTYDGVLPAGGVYICDECNSNEHTPFQLCEHKAIYHSQNEQRVWRCVYCKTTFGRRGGLRRHVQMVHMQMMHKCPVENCTHPGYKCTKALNAHLKTHTRPFSCNQCDEAFALYSDLQTHSATHQKLI